MGHDEGGKSGNVLLFIRRDPSQFEAEHHWGRLSLMRALDTSAEADALQRAIQQRLGGPLRLRLALDMSIAARALALARLRQQHPDYSELELKKALLRLMFAADNLPPPLR